METTMKQTVKAVRVNEFDFQLQEIDRVKKHDFVTNDARAKVAIKIINTIIDISLEICKYTFDDSDIIGEPKFSKLPQTITDIVDVDLTEILAEYKVLANEKLADRKAKLDVIHTNTYNSNQFVKFCVENNFKHNTYPIKPSLTLEEYLNKQNELSLHVIYGEGEWDRIKITYSEKVYKGSSVYGERTDRPYLLETNSFVDKAIRFATISKAIDHIIKKHQEAKEQAILQKERIQQKEAKKLSVLETIQAAFPEFTITAKTETHYNNYGGSYRNRNNSYEVTTYYINHELGNLPVSINEQTSTFNFAMFRNLSAEQVKSIINIAATK